MTRGDAGQFDDANASLGSTPKTKQKFVPIPFAKINYQQGHKWLVKGLLAATGLATIFGRKKEYKSFIALDLALHIVQGSPWAGRRVKQGAVIYLCGEGSGGFCDRVAANRERHSLSSDLPFILFSARPNLGTGEGDRAELVTAIESVIPQGAPLAAVFVDTLVRTLAGAAENDEGMRNFTDNAEAIAEHFDCLTVAVHHVGKDDSRGMRGSSALPAAVVTSWKVEKIAPMRARVTVEDAKDGPSGLAWEVGLERYVYGQDEDGDDKDVLLVREVTEPVPTESEPATDAKPRDAQIPPQMRLVMSCIEVALRSAGRRARPFSDGPEIKVVAIEAVRAEYYQRRGDEASDDAKRKSFDNSIKGGIERRIINAAEVSGQRVIWTSKR